MRNYSKNKESLYLMYLDAHHLSECPISQKLPVNSFKWKKATSIFNGRFIKVYHEERDEGYILEVDVSYSKRLYNLCNDLPFLPEKSKNRLKNFKSSYVICMTKINKYVAFIKTLKQALNHGLILKKDSKVTQFNQKPGLNYILISILN